MPVNHSPSARDLQAFLVFSQHPAWVITLVKLIESVVYCFYKITLSYKTHRKCGLLHKYLIVDFSDAKYFL